jgi:transposase
VNRVIADHPDRQIHVVLDNLNTHKPKRDLWLARHPNVHFHVTPTQALWMNQVEIWFSILSRSALQGASFTSPRSRPSTWWRIGALPRWPWLRRPWVGVAGFRWPAAG